MLSQVRTLGLFYWSVDLSWLGVWTLKCNSAGSWTRTSDHTDVKVSALTCWAVCWPLGRINWHIYLSFWGHWASKRMSAIIGFDPATLGLKVSSDWPWATATAAWDWSSGEFIFLFLPLFFKMQLWPLWDLNRQPWDSKSVVLHPELSADSWSTSPGTLISLCWLIGLQNGSVAMVRLEPATLGLRVRRHTHWAICWLSRSLSWWVYLSLWNSQALLFYDYLAWKRVTECKI